MKKKNRIKTITFLLALLMTISIIGYSNKVSANESVQEISLTQIESIQIVTNQQIEVAQSVPQDKNQIEKAKKEETPTPTTSVANTASSLSCSHSGKTYSKVTDEQSALMTQAGIAPEQQFAAGCIIYMESGWNYKATNPTSGAYGLPQSLPASKLASAGADWQTNPVTQLKWANNYATSRYGSWTKAHQFWMSNKWW